MSYRTILVELSSERVAETNLRVARRLAARFDASFVALHVVPPPYVPSTWDGGASVYIRPELLEAQRAAAEAARRRAEAAFRALCADDPRAVWREAEGDPATVLAEAARTADLLLVARPGPSALDDPDLPERLVMTTGVPVLILPQGAPEDLGRIILVGWSGSREATRAAHEALPFLTTAGRVILCAVGEGGVATLEPAAEMLRRHGVPVEPLAVTEPDDDAGAVLLAQAAAHDADLLVMGAYGHARLRELVFGGATRRVLSEATLPVLFSG
ncbi:universal stress protein [Benzoatithermus flavus]|uniref:Universal stress protein n=1 Tax=Benzoatithermus flavus TaxID=3108223 RepID=A0ABU8XZF4_9PROT